ncbi:F-box-like domain protein [Rhizoctonia solani 123E]|uniref:F-box-like domain protein n=1 Tax=Rhizoctonia solani 123E TaxID=1423351 RepID=A0A074RHD8_9AGAM|nr:F-box-like domain protein [Rhizoctonia solani 123E]
MSRELSAAGGQLRSAVDRYARSCSSVRGACLGGSRINNAPELLTSLEKESNDVVLYAQTLEEARTAIQLARSSIPRVGCGNKLPVEILTRIFDLVPSDGSCLVQRDNQRQISSIKYPLYPDSLAHVCSYWRRVAIAHPSLWTHIDIALDHYLNPGLFARAKTYVIRAGHLPLEIHISDPGSERETDRGFEIEDDSLTDEDSIHDPSHDWPDLHDFKIFTSDTVGIKSLELDLTIDHRHREVYYSVLEYFFARCKPGLLAQYIVRCVGSQSVEFRPFIEPVDRPHSLDGALLAVPSEHLEELWLHIPIVRINGLCPHWTSKAYHGLVELYIDAGIPGISESQIINVLESSPKLQVFHFNAHVIEDLVEVDTVFLEDLRDLNLLSGEDSDSGYSRANILPWIDPGTAPLQLSFSGPARGEASDFFGRANVTRFYLIYWQTCRLAGVFKESSRLDILALNGYDSDVQDLSFLLLPGYAKTTKSQIDTLYLLWFTQFDFEEIKAVVEKYSVQKLLIYGGLLTYQAVEGRVICENTRNIKVKLSSITTCPIIEYYPHACLIHQHCDDWIADALINY